jgi:hypothetical protein
LEVFDVYLEPLLEEILQLWYGISTYNITKERGMQTFTVRVGLMWTIHDFSNNQIVGGFFYQRYAVCPWCRPDLRAEHSMELGKQIYGGTKRWLPKNYIYKSFERKEHVDSKIEAHLISIPITMQEQLCYAVKYQAWRDAGNRLNAPGDLFKVHGVKKTCILNQLPY